VFAEIGQEVIRMLQAGDAPGSGELKDGDRGGERPQNEHLAVFDAAVAEIAAQVLPPYSAAEGWLERTRAGLVALLAALEERPETARALLIESIAWGPQVLERRGRLLEALAGALDQARGEVEPVGPLPASNGENLVGASLFWIQMRLAGETHQLVELAPSLMCMIAHPYLGAEAAQRELERPQTELGVEVAGRERQLPNGRLGADAPRRQ
jgi:hypothetical protein